MPIYRFLSKRPGFPQLSCLLLALTILGCDSNSTAPPDLKVARIVLAAEGITTIVPGERVQLVATAYNSRNEVLDSVDFVYQSTNTNIAQVNTHGIVFPTYAPGVAQITATSGSIVSNPITITIPHGAPDNIQLVDPFIGSLEVGTSTTIRLRVVDSEGTPLPNITTYLNTFGQGSVPNTKVVSDANGIVTTSWTIGTSTATSYRLGVSIPPYVLTEFHMNPKPGVPASLSLQHKYIFAGFPGSFPVEIRMLDRYGNGIDADRATYTVRNPAVVRVRALQVLEVEALSVGQTIVTVTANGFIDSLNVVISKRPGILVGTRIHTFEFKTDTVFTTNVFVAPEDVGAVGSATIRVTWDPNILTYQSSERLEWSVVDPVINATQASSGVLTFSFASTEGFLFTQDVLSLTFKTASTVGVHGTLKTEVFEATSARTFLDLLPYTSTFSQLIRLR